MIPQVCRSSSDVSSIQNWLKDLGYGHWQWGNTSVESTDMKKGVRINLYFTTTTHDDGSHPTIEITNIEVYRREALATYNGKKTKYILQCTFALHVRLGIWYSKAARYNKLSGFVEETDLTWEQSVKKVEELLKTLVGDKPISAKRYNGIIQTIILDDLKTRIKEKGHSNVQFVMKSKNAESASELAIRGTCDVGLYRNIVIGLKPGQMWIAFGQDSCAVRKDIACPAFEDPKFDPEHLIDAAMFAISEMGRLYDLYISFDEERSRTYNNIKQSFDNVWK